MTTGTTVDAEKTVYSVGAMLSDFSTPAFALNMQASFFAGAPGEK